MRRDIDAAVLAARTAFDDGPWRRLHYREKKRILFKFADLMERDVETLAVLESLDVGKPITTPSRAISRAPFNTLRYYAEALGQGLWRGRPADFGPLLVRRA